ncbi:MAG TPA: copper resistance protein CopC [Actinomycetes bacterium]|nr:copper resistance protein CopC [Actinomycetes bacterium]
MNHDSRSRRGRRLTAVPLALLLVGLWAGPAAAHSQLERTDPPENASLERSPVEVRLWFSEPVEVALGSVRVLDARGRRVDDGRVDHPGGDQRVLRVRLEGELRGGYAVGWRVVSADGHPVSGAFTFGVGQGTAGQARAVADELLAGAGGSRVVGVAFAVARWLLFAGLVLLVGAGVFVRVVWPAGRGDPVHRRLLWGAWAAAVVATVASVGLHGADAAALPLSGAFDPDLVGEVLATRFGVLAAARLALLLAAVPVALRLTRAPGAAPPEVAGGPGERAAGAAGPGVASQPAASGPGATGAAAPARFRSWADDLLVLLAAALLATLSLSGHAATGTLVALGVAVDVVHLAGISVWLGGLVVLLAAVLPRGDGAELRAVVPRFSRIAFAAVLTLVAAGLVQSWRLVGSLDALPSTTYGRVLLVKVAIVAAVVGLAWASRRLVRRRLVPAGASAARPVGPGAATASPATADAAAAAARVASGPLRRLVAAEAALAAVVLAVTALLVQAPPARSVTGGQISFGGLAPGAPTRAAFGASLTAGTSTVVVTAEPARTGANQLHFSVLGPSGQLLDVPELTAELSLPAQGLGPIRMQLLKLGPGHYVAASVLVPIKGDWRLHVVVRTSELDQAEATTTMPVR